MSCHDEHHDHHNHSHPDRGQEFTLFGKIDIENVTCLNESVPGSAKLVFKPWDKRWDLEPSLKSDADDQLIVRIPFTGLVKLKSVTILGPGGDGGECDPKTFKLYANRDDIDFDTVENIHPEQEFECVRQSRIGVGTGGGLGTQVDVPEYAVKVAKFSNLRNLTIFIPESWGGDETVVTYIGLKGEFFEAKRDPIVTVYEASANPADHKTKVDNKMSQGFGY